MKQLLYILLLLLLCHAGKAQKADTASQPVEVRQFDQQSIRDFKADDDFQYENIKEPVMSWWDRFWRWFWWWVGELMKTKGGRTTVWSVVIVLGIAILAFAIYKIMQMNKAGLFAKGSGKPLGYTVGHEDIHQINFDEAITSAIEGKDYRLAVRLMYLKSLKILSDRGIIDWKINKTNNDYVREVRDKAWQPLFGRLTYQFEYAWYGESKVSAEKFEMLRQEFHQLHNLV